MNTTLSENLSGNAATNNAISPFQLNGISKSFGSQQILNKLDWQAESGKIIGLLGRNGAGKSTLLECMLGLREIDSGCATLFGEPSHTLSNETRIKIGYVPQQSDLFEWMTPLQMLAYFKAFYPYWNDAKVNVLLDRWFDTPMRNKRIGNLSVGEKQRLSIIRALAHDPALLILDEPVASLDPVGRRDFLRELIERGIEHETTVIFSTHIMSDLERVALDVAFLKDGKIVLQQPLDSLLDNVRRISGPVNSLAALKFRNEISRTRSANGHATIFAILNEEETLVMDDLPNPGVTLSVVSLEDLFIEVTQ